MAFLMEMPIKSPTVRQVRLRTRIRRWRNASVTARVAASSGPAQAARHAPRLRWTKLDTQPAGREAPPMAPKTPPSPSKATKTGCGSEAVPHAQRQGLLLQRLAVVGATAHSCVQAEVVDVGAQRLLEVCVLGHALQAAPALASAGPSRGTGPSAGTVPCPRSAPCTVSTFCPARPARPGRGLQRPERAGLVRIAFAVGHRGRTFLFDQQPTKGEQPHPVGDDLVQHRLQRLVGRCGCFDEDRRAIGAAPVHAVQQQAVKVNVEVGRRAEALDQRDRAAKQSPVACRAACGSPRPRRRYAPKSRDSTAGERSRPAG